MFFSKEFAPVDFIFDNDYKIAIKLYWKKRELKLYALFDTGSTFSCISGDYAEQIGPLDKLEEPMLFSTASEGQYLQVGYTVNLDVEINDLLLTDDFMVVPGLSEEIIIGVATMQKWRIKIDFEHDTLIVDPKIAKFILKE